MRPVPYSEDKPYIFVSYSHKNNDIVLSIIQRMQQDGYRVWFDDNIPAASRYSKVIAEHVEKCSYFIAFISSDYISSDWCRKEMDLAIDEKKKHLIVQLDEIAFPTEWRMELNRSQKITSCDHTDECFLKSSMEQLTLTCVVMKLRRKSLNLIYRI